MSSAKPTRSLPLLLAPLVLAAALQEDDPIFRQTNVEDALTLAREQDRLVMLVFTRPASDEARKMIADTWTDTRVQQWIRSRAVALRLDVDWQPVLTGRYEVEQVPTVIFLEPGAREEGELDGARERERLVGPCDAATFLERAAQADEGDGPQGAARRAAAERPDDPRARLALAEAMKDAGRHVAALAEMLAVFDGSAGDPAWDFERRNALVPRILALQAHAPRARIELITRRNRLEATVLGDPAATATQAGDLAALNRSLGEVERSLLVWDKLDLQRHDTAAVRAALFPGVADVLLDQGRHDEVLEGCADVDARLERLLARLDALGDDVGPGDPLRLGLFDEAQKRALWHFHALLGAGRVEEARARADWLVALDGGERTWVLLVRHAGSAGARDEAYRLGTQAMQRLPPERQRRVHDALNDLNAAGG